jgi:hypothetical protein
MELIQVRENDQNKFLTASEIAMDCHLAQAEDEFYLVVGCRVGVLLNKQTFVDIETGYLDQPWLSPGYSYESRVAAFGQWLKQLPLAPVLAPATSSQAWQSFAASMIPVSPGSLPPPPPRPPSVYGHLPFVAQTLADTIIYRWEAFPASRRIDRIVNPPTIASGTYAAPASEAFFAQTGFAALARFALPNLLPACFRYELQPLVGTSLECGASVPLYGQSGGGVEVMFPNKTDNRCPIADPIVLPAL